MQNMIIVNDNGQAQAPRWGTAISPAATATADITAALVGGE